MRADRSPLVVIDTNVWIIAALSRSGAPARLVRIVLAQGVAVFSSGTFAELETRLWKPKFDRYLSLEHRQSLLHDVNAAAHWIEVTAVQAAMRYSRDPDDDVFIQTALAAGAPWLVTGDDDLLNVPPLNGLGILQPAEALALPMFADAQQPRS